MRGRPRESASASATSRYQGADGRWHARITVGRRLDGERDRRHITRKTKRELDAAIRELENVSFHRADGQVFAIAGYDYRGSHVHLIAAHAPYKQLAAMPATFAAVSRLAAEAPAVHARLPARPGDRCPVRAHGRSRRGRRAPCAPRARYRPPGRGRTRRDALGGQERRLLPAPAVPRQSASGSA